MYILYTCYGGLVIRIFLILAVEIPDFDADRAMTAAPVKKCNTTQLTAMFRGM